MRLISFVAISFLAITVSAKPPRSPWQFSQDEVEAEIERLKAEYKKEEESFFPMDDDVKIKRQTAIVLIDGVNSIAAKLKQTDLNSYTKSELENEYRAAKAEWDRFSKRCNKHYRVIKRPGKSIIMRRQNYTY
ncbi:hypothetical protein BASA62_005906 [Batrachochytrium salamandrivorans]|nr:hypothetical protein BASA62_005906 [Batrachochytrium salamandrivorans]